MHSLGFACPARTSECYLKGIFPNLQQMFKPQAFGIGIVRHIWTRKAKRLLGGYAVLILIFKLKIHKSRLQFFKSMSFIQGFSFFNT